MRTRDQEKKRWVENFVSCWKEENGEWDRQACDKVTGWLRDMVEGKEGSDGERMGNYEVTEDEWKEKLKVRGGRVYVCWDPPEAKGIWLGQWSWLRARFPKIQGERKRSVQEAKKGWGQDERPVFRVTE